MISGAIEGEEEGFAFSGSPYESDGDRASTYDQQDGYGIPGDDGELLRRLLRTWLNERNAPAILPFAFHFVSDLIELIDHQAERIEEAMAVAHERRQGTTEVALVRCLCQMEMERLKYVLQSYLVVRVKKIERLSPWLKRQPRAVLSTLLSVSEYDHLNRYRDLRRDALQRGLLISLPGPLATLPEEEEAEATDSTSTPIEEPDERAHVVVRCLKDFPALAIDPDNAHATEADVEAGSTFVCKWAAVNSLVLEGAAELL